MARARKKKAKPQSTGLEAEQVGASDPPAAVAELAERVESDGGSALAIYRDPFGGNWLILAAIPIDSIRPTPFQRELSETHAKRLEAVIEKVGRFLDPLVAVASDEGYWTPNGMHRLEALTRLGARSVVVLLVPETEIAYRILALNTEKAHNLKDKSLEVTRMAASLAGDDVTGSLPESNWAFEFEEPAYLTFGHCYEKKKRFSGSAYMPVVKRCEEFLDQPISETGEIRRARAAKLLELDKQIAACVSALTEAGHDSPYLKTFVVARTNPLRFKKGKRDQLYDFDETIDKMIAKAEKFDASSVSAQDLGRS